jgi:hypothetical protein
MTGVANAITGFRHGESAERRVSDVMVRGIDRRVSDVMVRGIDRRVSDVMVRSAARRVSNHPRP